MEKHINQSATLIAAGAHYLSVFQLEGGEEECQIKRLVLSASELNSDFGGKLTLGLFQKTPTIADFTDDVIIYTFAYRNQALLNETTTVRVPQGWFIGLLTENAGTTPGNFQSSVQINYLSLG